MMAGYRNRMVHFCDEVTPPALYRILRTRTGELEDLSGDLSRWMAGRPELVDTSLYRRAGAATGGPSGRDPARVDRRLRPPRAK